MKDPRTLVTLAAKEGRCRLKAGRKIKERETSAKRRTALGRIARIRKIANGRA